MSNKNPDFSNVQSSPDFSNVQSSVRSTAQTRGGGGGAGMQTYTVQAGDSLSEIARNFYGAASRYNEIFDANRDVLDDPDMIKPGQVLRIPAV